MPSHVLTRGEPMRVPITLRLETRRRVRYIFAEFHGAEETKADYTTTSTDSKGHTTVHHHTAVEHADIVKNEWLLAGKERRGRMKNMVDAMATLFGGGRHTKMMGMHDYEVEVVIPADAQPTHEGERSRVFYEASVRVDIALGRDLRAKQSFVVTPHPRGDSSGPVRVQYPDDEGRGFWDKIFAPDVRMELTLDRDVTGPGETIHVRFDIETQKALDVKGLHAQLVGKERSQAQGHHDSRHHAGEPMVVDTPHVVAGSWSVEFDLPVAWTGPATTKGKLYTIDWFVELALDVPWAKDPRIRAPIVLALG